MALRLHPVAEVAQLVEHSPEKAGVDSSILSLGTIFPHLQIVLHRKAADDHTFMKTAKGARHVRPQKDHGLEKWAVSRPG